MRLRTLPQKFRALLSYGANARSTTPPTRALYAGVKKMYYLSERIKQKQGEAPTRPRCGGSASGLVPVQLERDAPGHVYPIQSEECEGVAPRDGRLVPRRCPCRRQ